MKLSDGSKNICKYQLHAFQQIFPSECTAFPWKCPHEAMHYKNASPGSYGGLNSKSATWQERTIHCKSFDNTGRYFSYVLIQELFAFWYLHIEMPLPFLSSPAFCICVSLLGSRGHLSLTLLIFSFSNGQTGSLIWTKGKTSPETHVKQYIWHSPLQKISDCSFLPDDNNFHKGFH